MDPTSLVTPNLVKYCEQFNTIVVCGYTKTGKYPIAKKLANELNRKLIVSDDYGIENYEEFVYNVIHNYNQQIPLIIEG